MKERLIGEIIKDRREELNMKQKDLCEGICEPPTLSRIENNKQNPTRKVLNALLQRLGISDDRFYAAITVEELRVNKLFNEIERYNVKYEKVDLKEKKIIRDILLKMQEELLSLLESDDMLSRQFIIKSQVLISDEPNDLKLKKLMDALRMTHPSVDLKNIQNGLFSFDEITLLNQIAVVYSESADSSQAIRIWEQLLRNIEGRFENIALAWTQKDLILYGLSREWLILGNHRKALYYAEEGKKIATDYGLYQHLPGFVIILAECEYNLDNNSAKSEELFKEAYYLCRAIDDTANKKIVIKALQDYFNLEMN